MGSRIIDVRPVVEIVAAYLSTGKPEVIETLEDINFGHKLQEAKNLIQSGRVRIAESSFVYYDGNCDCDEYDCDCGIEEVVNYNVVNNLDYKVGHDIGSSIIIDDNKLFYSSLGEFHR